ncbi:MAG: hypothetical protein IKN54_02305 [Lachnospiraceae bacterium]|nr:hypothetical protein [Lachnospiraceae bacterium]
MAKTSEAAKRAAVRYKNKKDSCMVYFPAGTAAAVRAQGVSVSGLCCDLVAGWLAERGVNIADYAPQDSTQAPESANKVKGAHTRDNIDTDTPQTAETPTSAAGGASVGKGIPRIIDIDTFI